MKRTTKAEQRKVKDDAYWEAAAKQMLKSPNFTQLFAEHKAALSASRKRK